MTARPRVLLVDDDVDTRDMYAWSLEARGFDVLSAGNAAIATAMAVERRPDAIVTDFTLPGEDGFVLATRIRAARGLQDTPMVLVSGRAFVGNTGERAMEVFDRVLLKPVLPDDLIGEIVPLMLDRAAGRLQRQLRDVRQRLAGVPRGSDAGRVMSAVSEVATGGALPAALLADSAARYIDVNDAACSLTGRTRGELLTMAVWDLTPQVALAEGRRAWARFVADGALAGAYRLRSATGEPIEATYAAAAHVLPGCHLSLLNRLPPALLPGESRAV